MNVCIDKMIICIYNERESHVGTGFASFRFFFAEKSVTRAVIPPLSQKGTLGSRVRLQALTTAHCRYHLFASIFRTFGRVSFFRSP